MADATNLSTSQDSEAILVGKVCEVGFRLFEIANGEEILGFFVNSLLRVGFAYSHGVSGFSLSMENILRLQRVWLFSIAFLFRVFY
jgi:hypothetical protein